MTLTISFPAETEAMLRDRAEATGKDVPTLVREAVEAKLMASDVRGGLPAKVAAAIQTSRELLDLRDEEENLMIAPATLDRAIQFLASCVRGAIDAHGVTLEPPAILPGPHASVDLHWKHRSYEMLINIPADPTAMVTYYGDDRERNSVKGTIASGDNRGLLLWLTTRA